MTVAAQPDRKRHSWIGGCALDDRAQAAVVIALAAPALFVYTLVTGQ